MALEIISKDERGNSENIVEAKAVHKNATIQQKRLIGERKNKMKELREVKVGISTERKRQVGDEGGIENLLFDILDKYNIKRQSFHGGAMNVVCCRRLLDNIDKIFEEIVRMIESKIITRK